MQAFLAAMPSGPGPIDDDLIARVRTSGALSEEKLRAFVDAVARA